MRYWLPVLLWIAVIFGASGDSFSSAQTSSILEAVLRWWMPTLSEATLAHVHLVVRKLAHLTEYAVLAWLWWRALRRPVKRDSRPWDWTPARAAFLASFVNAALDESHQALTVSRTGSIWDVMLDGAGAALGLVVVWRARRG